jgi:hypothetical protein
LLATPILTQKLNAKVKTSTQNPKDQTINVKYQSSKLKINLNDKYPMTKPWF